MARVLVVDDEELVRKLLNKVLRRAGYEVVLATNGKEGVQRYADQPADAVIMDLIMPEQEGMETIVALRRMAPDVKIIAITGGGCVGAQDYLRVAQNLGASRCLPKPIDLDDLRQTVAELLEN